ncbi:glycosyltransferase family 2 protein [Marinobacter fonticola]|uniref:glycosyltransferase family 2 protein n=1 Tax=Marinobacter fonticola TaxID=2603215 RepID=UPI0011E61E4C|nr:glycosyltransferase family 2 protein [Marinobacter fonticola]
MTSINTEHRAVALPTKLLSIIVPVFNERAVLPILLEHLRPILRQLELRTEIVFVDDGSEDGSAEFIRGEILKDSSLRLGRLSRNFGKEAALTAGIELARGHAIVILDADLQDPPELIPDMVARWQAGADVVLMQRRSRSGESGFKRFCAYGFYRILNRACRGTIPVDTGDFRLMSRKAVDALLTLEERNRYMKGLFAWVGLPTAVIEYDRAPRSAGVSKWDTFGLFGLALEALTSFSIMPLRWTAGIGLTAAIAGALFGLWIVAKALILGNVTAGYPSLIAIITFLGGMQLLGIGIVGEYVGKTYLESKRRPVYILRDIVEQSGPADRSINTFHEASRYVEAG